MVDCNGLWLFPTFSFLSHSCISNSRFFVHPGDIVVVRAQTDVKAGMEVTIPYTDPFSGNVFRRESIGNLWYFLCCCERCLDVTELGTFVSAVRCRMCIASEEEGCRSFLLPANSEDLHADWSCSQCQNIISNKTIVMLVKGLKNKVKEKDVDLAGILDLLTSLEEFLHPNHFLILELKQNWVNMASKSEKNDKDTLENTINFISDIMKINKKIDPVTK
eukprot:TRINITY_DN41052_c0_g1_i2.p1 TRINITY_DN41052_c0_g1~~TRINITY_DN41052_c0_g1_i2.p1  ORF type:complete len:219 (-),score=38.73 TRINITY_DN41052_c0_g1_i2:303-959(-)